MVRLAPRRLRAEERETSASRVSWVNEAWFAEKSGAVSASEVKTPVVTVARVAKTARGAAIFAALGIRRALVSRLWLLWATALILCCC